jgi:flagellum-specific ATP synthase
VSRPALGRFFEQLRTTPAWYWEGRLTQVIGALAEATGVVGAVGESCVMVDRSGRQFAGEIVGFRRGTLLAMPLERPEGLGLGDRLLTWGARPCLPVSAGLLGRVVDSMGAPLDGGPALASEDYAELEADPPSALARVPIRDPLACGIRAIDGLLSCGRGQRLGIFGGSGVGKSTLVGMMARGTDADLTVLALVGERGREVGEFLETLGEEGRRRAVVVVSTSDQSPLLRIRAGLGATAIAEYFCRRGRNVLLVIDSLTRLATAQRELGLAAGEPPTAKGYTPSVFSQLARLVERAGRFREGSITAFYSVLMEGDDQQDPLVDAVRALLDGHIVLERTLAARGHYPPISVLDSLSRLMPAVATGEHLARAQLLRRLLAAYRASEDLVRIGAYQKGADAELDRALALMSALERFLMQSPVERSSWAETLAALETLAG